MVACNLSERKIRSVLFFVSATLRLIECINFDGFPKTFTVKRLRSVFDLFVYQDVYKRQTVNTGLGNGVLKKSYKVLYT